MDKAMKTAKPPEIVLVFYDPAAYTVEHGKNNR
jgi:hypothetical protein